MQGVVTTSKSGRAPGRIDDYALSDRLDHLNICPMESLLPGCQRLVSPAATGSLGDRIGEQPAVQANRRPTGRKGSPMLTLFQYLQARRDDEGVTAVEYALIAALVAVAIIVAVTFLGGAISGTFNHVGSAVSSGT